MSPDRQPSQPDRNLAMELVRATEVAALSASRWMGLGDKEAADQAAVDGLRAGNHFHGWRGVDR